MIVRFKISLLNCTKIPATYRKNFVSLIKEAFNQSGNKEIKDLNLSAKPKPFTFSLKFLIKNFSDGQLELKDNVFDFYFSTNDYLILMSVYNFMISRLSTYNIFQNCKNTLIKAMLLSKAKIDKDYVVFKTLSPIVVRDMINKNGNKTLKFSDEKFVDNLQLSIKSLIKTFKNQYIDQSSIFIKVLKMKSDNINSFGSNKNLYGLYVNSGLIELSLKSEYLQLLYDIGIGAKRSQGFGMVEKIL
ncbi:CRISPR-associated protein, TM1814 family [Desulfurella amilsii]|uniref:CRISPR-associated protein, TM1814 family n=1 Tax=Desulfurella amilsii TaxID=1562698 RepID=A0A1X4XVG2_9BACT|nr:CRISPR-associated endoribonuclease Cas6 [Desulfurella amilsii]OSS41514.1 CRISPR-associated protein, TM1814 family [Desulfurella amilsii]